MNVFTRSISALDALQQRYHLSAFTVAVFKKYGEDRAGQHAALLTYYAFLSIFPLLLILTTILQLIIGDHPQLEHSIINAVTDYIPVLGDQLSAHLGGLHRSGLALATGLLFILYGTRGVADAFRYGVNHLWQVPRREQPGMPVSLFKSLGLIIVGGIGFIGVAIITGVTAAAGHGVLFVVASGLVSGVLLFGLFNFLLNMSLPRHVSFKDVRSAAAMAAIGLTALQLLGTYLLRQELRNLDALYSYFALSLGLLFWIYLQAQVLYFAVEIATVHTKRLWPRSIDGSHPTDADHRQEITKNN